MSSEILSEQYNFKAWTEASGSNDEQKLHVHGQVQVSDESLLYQLDKKDEQGYFEDELFLEIKPEPMKGDKKVEIKYHEQLEAGKSYKKITIFAKSTQVYEIHEVTQGKS